MSSKVQQVASEYTVAARCVAVVLKPAKDQLGTSENKVRTEREIFKDFVDENRTCYWNPHLKESIENVRFAGYLLESLCLLLAGRDMYLNTVLDAWSRRVLRPPQGFVIHTAGEISPLEIQTPSQCLFTPLPEVLCLIISDCNRVRVCATFDVIMAQLQQHYSSVQQPDETFVYVTLENLMKERKIYHSGSGYFIVTPDTLQLNNCITVVDNHVIIGSTGSHDNGVRAIYLPLLAAGKMEKKSASCQTETKASGNCSGEVESYMMPPKGKISAKVKSCQTGLKKDRDLSGGKDSDGSRNPSPDVLVNKIPVAGEPRSLLKRILSRNKKSSGGDVTQMIKEDNLIATPLDSTPCPKSRESDRFQTANDRQEEPSKVKTKSAVKSNSTRERSSLLRRSCLGFTARKRLSAKDETEYDGDLIQKSQTRRTHRSRSMSPEPRSSSLNLTLDELSLSTDNYYQVPKERTPDNKRKRLPTEKRPSFKNNQHFKSTESLYDFDVHDQKDKIFELELSKPHEVIVKTKRTALDHFPDSHKQISRIYRKYHRMKDSSSGKVSHYIRRKGNLVHRSGRSLSQDSGLNRIGEVAEKDSPFLTFFPKRNDRSSGLARIETVTANAEHLRKAEVHTPAAEDSGFLSFQLGSTVSPFCLSLEPVQHSTHQKPLPNDSFNIELADGQDQPSEKAYSERSKYPAPRSSCSLSRTSVPVNASVLCDRDSLVPAVDSCQTGSSWSNSSRQTVVEMLNAEQIAQNGLIDPSVNDWDNVNEPRHLVTPSFSGETLTQVDPWTVPESDTSSSLRMPCSQNQTDSSAMSRSPIETASIDSETQTTGRNRLCGVSSRSSICK